MDSDSVDLGSNPGPPASLSLGNPPLSQAGHGGHLGHGQRTQPHKNRHNADNRRPPTGGPPVRAKRRPPTTFVYFMYCAGYIKIGFSTDARLRHMGMCTAFPLKVTLLLTMHGDRAMERSFHLQFASARTNGEWFDFSPEIRSFLHERLSATVAGAGILARAEAEFSDWVHGHALNQRSAA